ncbi:MAG: Unknown protein [uncultured Sulfurovum sp.]|uniref:Porin domain-containing protein n=1 Tax=uncultured Sulfurovum sp. TaxID=269237 RepID=A0A6S6S5H0_9BACT|nr:MAG: Unknown protein [uncultured Sulfurovum sp.]
MKFTKLSLITVLAVSTMTTIAVAGDTTVGGKAQVYYYTTDGAGTSDLGSNGTSATGTAVTLDVAHKLSNAITANFTAVGYTHLGDDMGANKFEASKADGFFNVANLTGSFGDTTVVAGRQLLATPMLAGFDWLLAPGSFEAATLVNKSMDKFTFIASYINKYRGNNTGDNFVRLADDNYAFSAGYSDVVDANLWFYNIDALNYTQVYGDVSKEFNGVSISGQGVKTNYDTGLDSTGYGLKVGMALSSVDMSVAYNHMEDRAAGLLGVDSVYTTSWNSFASQDVGDSWKVDASTEIAGVSATASYADYETIGSEFDVILGYGLTENTSLDAIYSSTKYAESDTADNALELIGTYTF